MSHCQAAGPGASDMETGTLGALLLIQTRLSIYHIIRNGWILNIGSTFHHRDAVLG